MYEIVSLRDQLMPYGHSTSGPYSKQNCDSLKSHIIHQTTHLHGDDAARFVVVGFAGVVLVEGVELWVGLVAEGLGPHCVEVKMEAVQQEVHLDARLPGLGAHRRRGTQDERRAAHCAARVILGDT